MSVSQQPGKQLLSGYVTATPVTTEQSYSVAFTNGGTAIKQAIAATTVDLYAVHFSVAPTGGVVAGSFTLSLLAGASGSELVLASFTFSGITTGAAIYVGPMSRDLSVPLFIPSGTRLALQTSNTGLVATSLVTLVPASTLRYTLP